MKKVGLRALAILMDVIAAIGTICGTLSFVHGNLNGAVAIALGIILVLVSDRLYESTERYE